MELQAMSAPQTQVSVLEPCCAIVHSCMLPACFADPSRQHVCMRLPSHVFSHAFFLCLSVDFAISGQVANGVWEAEPCSLACMAQWAIEMPSHTCCSSG